MTVQHVSDPKTPIGDILRAAGSEGLLLESEDQSRYAVIPLDDDLIDYLIERNPKFIAECREILDRMRAGQSHSHDDVKQMLASD